MVSFRSLCSFLLSFSFVFLSQFSNFIDAQAGGYGYPTATLSTLWTNNATADDSVQYTDGSIVQSILLRGSDAYDPRNPDKPAYGPAYACGFYCNGNCNTYLLAVFIVQVSGGMIFRRNMGFPQVVWSANRNNPVKIGATLELTSEGDLVLKDPDGTVAWSTSTSGKSIVGLNLTDLGNLVLFDKNNAAVWQSFDHPTDSLVPGQKLMAGQRLMPSVSQTNWTVDSMITLSMNSTGLFAQMETSPPYVYYQYPIANPQASNEFPYVEFVNGSLALFSNSTMNVSVISTPQASFTQYMKLGSDGHLRVYEWVTGWEEAADLLTSYLADCGYPTACGQYGICSNGQCSCPASSGGASYFKQVDERHPTLGCSENVPLSCGASQYQSLLELEDVTCLTFTSNLENIDASICKETCTKNCSCKAAIFRYELNLTNGSCYLLTQVFTLINIDKDNIYYFHSIAYLKVQNEAPNTSVGNQRSNRLPVILGSSLGVLFAVIFLIVVIVLFVRKRDDNEAEEDYLDQAPYL
ncbi:hypothetical protein NL676_001088 [Syzygium grande]|nr:hypothetical protein NL676_001088 [Syzygium grande]